MKKILIILTAVVAIVLLAISGYFLLASKTQAPIACTMEAKICPDGSVVGRTGPKCEFASCPNIIVYKNTEFGFELAFPLTWKGYSVEIQTWQGWKIDGSGTGKVGDYSGPLVFIKNPQTTASQRWQDIPIMVFTPEVWAMVSGNNPTVAVSAAPIGPAKIGENAKYIFATPPRWYGFTDAIGFEEAVNIVKTFKTF